MTEKDHDDDHPVLPVPPGHWLDSNAAEAWKRYYERQEQEYLRRMGDAVR